MAIQLQTQKYPENLGLPLGASQDWFMDNFNHTNNNNNLLFNELNFNYQQKQQQQYLLHLYKQQQILQQQQQQQYLVENLQNNQSVSCHNGNNNASTTTGSTTTAISDQKPINFSQGLAAQLEKQGREIDRYILLQNERMKVALQQQTKQQVVELWRKLEAKGMMMVQHKDKEIAKATERRRELEQSMMKMEAEKEAWRRLAVENESMVVSLNNTLEQVKEQAARCCFNGADDAESCCDNNEYKEGEETGEEGESGRMKKKMKMKMKVCRVCKCREASVLLLPCRHLCCCVACHGFLDNCPVCNSVKKACIEALLS